MGPTSYIDDSLRSFLVKLGDRTPEPAGGAALALAGASAAALMSLACHTVQDETSAARDERPAETCRLESEGLSERIQDLIDEDVRAYRRVLDALRLPRTTDEERRVRRQTLDDALDAAAAVPLQVAQASLRVLELAVEVEPAVDAAVAGDLAAAVHLAEAAARGSLRNARVNAAAMGDAARTHAVVRRADRLAGDVARYSTLAEAALRARGLSG